MKYRNRKKIFLILLLSLVFMMAGCRKTDEDLTGNWQGVLTIELSHQYEEYQEWEEVIRRQGQPDEVIIHIEHVTWSFTDRVVMEFRFTLDEPLYQSQISGKGNGSQEVQFTGPSQCQVRVVEAPGFEFSVFGSVDSTTFDLQVVPDEIPVISIDQACQHVQVRLPAYSTALVQVFSNLRQNIPIQSGITIGGSGTVSLGSGYSPLAYIYNFTLNKG